MNWLQGSGGQTPQVEPPDWWIQKTAQEEAEEEERKRIPDECITTTEDGIELIDWDLAK